MQSGSFKRCGIPLHMLKRSLPPGFDMVNPVETDPENRSVTILGPSGRVRLDPEVAAVWQAIPDSAGRTLSSGHALQVTPKLVASLLALESLGVVSRQ